MTGKEAFTALPPSDLSRRAGDAGGTPGRPGRRRPRGCAPDRARARAAGGWRRRRGLRPAPPPEPGRTRAGRAGPRRRRSAGTGRSASTSLLPGVPGDALVDLGIALPRRLDDLVRDLRTRRRLVPAGAARPVADELLVERVLRAARLPLVDRPEPGRVGRQD